MPSKIFPLIVSDFTGGLNLRADAFQLAENESPDMLNVEIDPRGGFYSRFGWVSWNTNPVTASWNPQSLHSFVKSDGSSQFVLANSGYLLYGKDNAFASLKLGGVDCPVSAVPHGVDCAVWGDTLYAVRGAGKTAVKWDGGTTGLVELDEVGVDNWQEDYLNPNGSHVPSAELCTSHLNYLFVAGTREDGVDYPNRVRWSHPNVPESWASADYVDVLRGGSRITAIVPHADHLVIFKTNSVWALFGFDADTWQLVEISDSVGCLSRNSVAAAPGVVYFFSSDPVGIFAYSVQSGLVEVGVQLRPAFESGELKTGSGSRVFFGWLNKRLWCSFERSIDSGGGGDVFVLDPTLGDGFGAWVRHRFASGEGLGPLVSLRMSDLDGAGFGCHPSQGYVLELEKRGVFKDGVGGSEFGFDSFYATRWFDGGIPTLKKSWRRPDLVMKDRDNPVTVRFDVYRDFDETGLRRQFTVDLGSGAENEWGAAGLVWGAADEFWGLQDGGSVIAKGKFLGLARAVQLRIFGESADWGVDSIVLKFRPRRLR